MVPIFEVKEKFSALRGLLAPVLSRAICLAVDSSRAITASLVFKSGFKARLRCLEYLVITQQADHLTNLPPP